MKAIVLEKKRSLSVREIEIVEKMGPNDVRVKMGCIGICGSDLHYYLDGYIGFRIVREPLVLGHEGSGIIMETGENVTNLKVGDRVCMEPQVPDPNSKASRLGIYNLDPNVRFWAAPPNHGCMRESVVHPAMFTYKLADNLSLAEGAMTEPLAVGLYAATKAKIKPGDTALVLGAGTIGLVTAMALQAAGCGKVIISDVLQEKLDLASSFGLIPVNVFKEKLYDVVMSITGGWGADVILEASGSESALANIFEPLCPGGRVVLIGAPGKPPTFDIYRGMTKGVTIETVFRYAHVYPRALSLIESGKINLKPLITDTFPFDRGVEAFELAASRKPTTVKVMIETESAP
jgi:D-xylulose reductase